MVEEQGSYSTLTFDDILGHIPEKAPNRPSFDQIVGHIPTGQPAGFEINEPPKEYGAVQSWFQDLVEPSREEIMGQAQGIIALSELTGQSPTEIALDNNTLKDVYEEPTIGEAVKMRTDQVANRFTTAQEMFESSREWAFAFQNQDEMALLEATARYKMAAQQQQDDPRLGKYEGWILRSVSDLSGQLYGQFNGAKGYFAAGAALGTVTAGPGGTLGGAGIAGGYGLLRQMYYSALGSQAMGKIEDGMDPRFAYYSSTPAAMMVAVSERLQLNALVRNIPGVKKIMATGLATAAKKVEAWTLTRVGAEALRSGLEGSSQEAFQAIIEQLDLEISKELSNRFYGTDIAPQTVEQIVEEVKKTFMEVLPGMMILGGAGAGAGYSAELINQKADQRLLAEGAAAQIRGIADQTTPEVATETTFRDQYGAETTPEETIPVDEGVTVINEDGDVQATAEPTPVEVAEQELRTREPLMSDEEFDDLVMTPDEDLDAAIDQIITRAEQQGDFYGEFTANIREALGKKQAKVVEDLIEARARATNRTPEQFAQDHKLRFGVERDESGIWNASVEFIQDGETIIRAFQNATLRDVTHELSHVFRKDLNNSELKAAEQAFGVQDGQWDRAAEERFSDGFIQYMADGKAPNELIQGIFERFKLWLGKLYETVTGSGVTVTPEMEAIFNSMLAANVNEDYQHRMGQARQATHTLFSEAGVDEKVGPEPQKKRRTAAEIQKARLENIISEKEALRQALKDKVITARQAAAQGRRIGYNQARAEAYVVAQRASRRSKLQKERSKWRAKITKLVKAAKTKKQSGKRKGKFTADFQDIADTFIEIMSMPVAEAKKLAQEMQYENVPPDFGSDMDTLRRWLIRTRANSNRMDANALKQLHDDLQALFEDQVAIRHSEMRPIIERVRQVKAALLESLANIRARKGLDPNVKNAYENHVSGFKQLVDKVGAEVLYDFHGLMERLDMGMDLLFGEGFMVRFTETLEAENASNTNRRVMNTRMLMEAAEIYGWKDKDGNPDIKMAERKFWEEERQGRRLLAKWEILRKNEEGELEGTGRYHEEMGNTATLRNLWMKLQDPKIREQYENSGMTDDIMRELRAQLTEQDLDFIDAQFQTYQEYYDRVNEVYRRHEGTNLPKNAMYSPIIRDVNEPSTDGPLSDLLTDMSRATQYVAPGSVRIIERVPSNAFIKPTSDIDILNTYIRQMEHYIAFRGLVSEWNLLFNDDQVRSAIRDTYGKSYLELIDKLILNISRNGSFDKNALGLDSLMRDIRGNLARGMVGAKVLSVPKQLSSFLAFSEGIPLNEFMLEMGNFLKDPKAHWEEMKQWSEFVVNRPDRVDRDIAMLTNSSEYKGWLRGVLPPSFNHLTMMFVKTGDIGAIIAGGWARYQVLRKQGVGHEEAIRDMELLARNTQQSSELGSMSAAQQGGEFMRLMTMFSSAQRQYFQRVLLAWEANRAGRMSQAESTKRLLMYAIALPTLFQLVSQGGAEDEDDLRNIVRAIAVSPIQAVPAGGLVGQYVVNQLVLGHTFGRGAGNMAIFSPVERSMKGMNKLMRMSVDDITMSDVLMAIRDLLAVGEYAGIPVGGMMNVPVGLQHMIEGEGLQGSLEVMGMSPYTAEKRANK